MDHYIKTDRLRCPYCGNEDDVDPQQDNWDEFIASGYVYIDCCCFNCNSDFTAYAFIQEIGYDDKEEDDG